MSKEKKKKYNYIILLCLIFIALLIVSTFLLYYYSRHEDAFNIKTNLYDLSSNCTLSLCDCKCYLTQDLPEIKNVKICGNDCYGRFNIVGCNYENNTCKISTK